MDRIMTDRQTDSQRRKDKKWRVTLKGISLMGTRKKISPARRKNLRSVNFNAKFQEVRIKMSSQYIFG